jgi:general secretion pathway protein D
VGCAAQRAYEEGRSMLDRGDTGAAITKLQQAAALDPRSATYRLAYLQARERAIADVLRAADAHLAQNRLPEAERAYRQALTMEPGHERADAALKDIDSQRRHDKQLRAAEDAWARKDAAAALALLKPILIESPSHAQAQTLRRRIAEAIARPAMEPRLAEAYRKPLTIEFKEAPLRTVFEVISRTSGLNFVFDKDVRGDQKTTIFLRNTTTDEALQILMLTNQLERRVLDANSLLIYPNTPAKLKDYQPTSVRSFYLANADAKSVANTLKTITKTRDVVVDERLNLVILRDSPEVLRVAEKLVALHDLPEPEVMLEVEILEVKRSRLLDLGVQLPDQLTLTPLPATQGGALTLEDLRNLNRSRIGASVGAITVNAAKIDGDTNILANPRIRARNREKAKILIGERVPNISTTATSTGFISESVTYVDVGLKLDVEPVIYPEDEVVMKVSLEVSNIVSQIQTKSGTLAYQIGTRTASTVLRLRDGENQVLAGLINDEDRPLVRHACRRHHQDRDRVVDYATGAAQHSQALCRRDGVRSRHRVQPRSTQRGTGVVGTAKPGCCRPCGSSRRCCTHRTRNGDSIARSCGFARGRAARCRWPCCDVDLARHDAGARRRAADGAADGAVRRATGQRTAHGHLRSACAAGDERAGRGFPATGRRTGYVLKPCRFFGLGCDLGG